jgi:hypothetical protein
VAAAVEAADFSSAFAHYWQRGRFEGRSGVPGAQDGSN